MRTAFYAQHFAGDMISFGKIKDCVGDVFRVRNGSHPAKEASGTPWGSPGAWACSELRTALKLSRGLHWYHVVIEKLLSPFNRSFKIVEEYDSPHSIFASIEAGRGVAIAHSVVALTTGERLVFRPLKPVVPSLPIVLAYRQEAASPLIRAFVAAAISVRQ